MKNLICIARNNEAYTFSKYNFEEDDYQYIITYTTFDKLTSNITEDILVDSVIVFDNNDMRLTRFLIENFKAYLLEMTNIFGRKVKGVSPSQAIKSYGYDYDVVKSVEYTTNMNRYLIMKGKGL